MTIAKDFASKFAVAFVAVAMLFTLVAPAVNAAETAEDLQKTIADLLAQVAELEGKTADADSSASCEAIAAPLTMGSTGANVTALQNRLIADGEAIAAGATGYFGMQTKAALASWQGKNSVSPAVGYYGPLTAAAMAASCDGDMDEDTDEDTSSDELQGEGSLNTSDTDLDDASDDTIMEGEEDAEIATLTLGAEDGDIEVSRLDFSLVDTTGGTANQSDLWETFETISLWVDGDMIGEFEADDEDNYLNENTGTFRVSGLDLVIMEDEEVEIVVAATVMGAVDGSDTTNAADWSLDATDVRYFDADGVASDDALTGTSVVTFEVVEEGVDDDATIESNSDTPEPATLKVDDQDADSDEFDVHTFDIDVDEDSSDLVFADMAHATVTVTGAGVGTSVGATYNDVVEAVYMTIDGESVEGDNITVLTGSVAGVAVASVGYEFDFEDVELPAGEVTEATISIVFKGQDSVYDNGVTVATNVDGSNWEVEGIAGDANVLTGTDTSESFALATVVPVISDVVADTTADDPNNSGTISFEFTVEADGDEDVVGFDIADVLTTLSSTASTSLTPTGVLSKTSGDATLTAPGVYTIADGDIATFAVDFTYTTASAANNGTYRVTLDSVLGVEVDKTSTGLGLSF